jgi:segregation and condensation protein B
MEINNLIPHIEALIFASDKPLTTLEIVDLTNNAFSFMDEKVSLDQVETSLEGIVEKYKAEFYPFEVIQTIAQLNGDKFLKKLSAAAMETLSIIAYKQPVTKGQVEAIRGVSADYAIQKLLEKELIVISGRNETMPGHPLVYATSKSFMDYFGINTPDDLPKIKEVLAEQIIEPTIVNESDFISESANTEEAPVATQTEEPTNLAVTESGELIENKDEQEGEEN